MAPTFLTLAEVLEIHRDQIERYGGDPGLRDLGLLKSALAMPAAGVMGQYLHAGLHEMAAAYAFHIVTNHPFVDGNKRTGAAAAYIFLALNDMDLTAGEAAFERVIRAMAEGQADKSVLTAFFREHTEPMPPPT